MFDLSGRSIVITGGSSGIGNSMARALGDAGAKLGIVSRQAPADWPCPPPRNWNASSDWIAADLADGERTVQLITRWAEENDGALDGLILSAVDYGSAARHPFQETTLAEWDRMFSVNTRGAFLVTRTCLPFMLRCDRGVIVSVTSDVARVPGPFRAGYAASKAAQKVMLESVAGEIYGSNVRIVQIEPKLQFATPGLASRRPSGFSFEGYLSPDAFAGPICRIVHAFGDGMNDDVVMVGRDDEITFAS